MATLFPSAPAAAYDLYGYRIRTGKDPFPAITSDIKKWRFTEAFAAVTDRMNSDSKLSSDERVSLRVTLGAILKMLGKWNDALACFAEILKADPKSALAHHFVAVLNLSARNMPVARQYCDKLRALQPENPWPYVISGIIYSFEGRQEKAYSDIKKALKLDSALFEGHAYMFQYYKRTGKFELAKKELKKLLTLEPNFELSPFFSATMASDPRSARDRVRSEVLYEHGLLMYNYSHEPIMALKYYSESIKKNPGFIKAKFARAQCLLLLNRRETARNLLSEIIRSEPAFNAAYEVVKKLDSGLDVSDFIGTNLETQKPNFILKSRGFCRNCGEARKRGAEKCPNCKKAYDDEETKSKTAEAGKAAVHDTSEASLASAVEQENSGLESETQYDRFFEIGIDNLENKEYESAEISFKNIIKLMPHLPEGYNMLGITYLGMGKNDLAVKNFKKAVSLNTDFAEGYFSLGKAYEIEGRTDDAKAMYKKSLKINSEYEEARQALENIDKNNKNKK